MKKLIIPVSVLIILLAFTSPALACSDCQRTFWTTGYTTVYDYEVLDNGLTRFRLTAQGGENDALYDPYCAMWATQYGRPDITTCSQACLEIAGRECGVSGDISGSFQFQERGLVDFNPETGTGSGMGTNQGKLMVTSDNGKIRFSFAGKTDSVSVWGRFNVLGGTGRYKNLEGNGIYRGMAGLIFTVKYTGRYCGPE